jgi:pimeloyl-ACP methyl ester carboxylesterase
VRPLYRLLGTDGNLRILWRPGSHETGPDTIERYLDWCDARFGRGNHAFPEELPFPWDWDAWRARATSLPEPGTLPETTWEQQATTGNSAPDQTRKEAVRAAVQRVLGTEPPGAAAQNDDYGLESDGLKYALHRYEAGTGLEMEDTMFGEYINANIYMPKGVKEGRKRLPGVLWLPADSIPGGYTVPYKRGDYAYRNVARAGYAVFCYDPIGTGRRIPEIQGFYDRYPDWSVLGKMVRDARAALDAMRQLPYIDPDHITVLGYAQGAFVAAHLAALDDRPARFVLVAPPLPYRLDRDINETDGVLRWSKDSMLLPALGLFAGNETRIPYDLDGLLALAAPKPLLLVHPKHDRFAPAGPFNAFAARMKAVYTAMRKTDSLVVVEPGTYNQFNEDVQKEVIAAMAEKPRS